MRPRLQRRAPSARGWWGGAPRIPGRSAPGAARGGGGEDRPATGALGGRRWAHRRSRAAPGCDRSSNPPPCPRHRRAADRRSVGVAGIPTPRVCGRRARPCRARAARLDPRNRAEGGRASARDRGGRERAGWRRRRAAAQAQPYRCPLRPGGPTRSIGMAELEYVLLTVLRIIRTADRRVAAGLRRPPA